jgi:DNA-binding NtrC family response regulator
VIGALAPGQQASRAAHELGVLIVDDDPIILMDMAQSLADAGIVVFEARNADEALQVLSTRTDVRMTITDVDMGGEGLDGFQLAKMIATRWPEVGLLIVSGQSRPKATDLPEGARFLAKPCASSSLIGNLFAFVGQQNGSI